MRRWFDMTRLRLRALFNRGRADADLDRELRAHLEQQVEELTARGMSLNEARRTAVSRFGGVERVREESRDARGVSIMENIGRDLRYALRGLRREPMLLAAATISIAVGAAGNLAVFSLAREFIFSAPDVRDPGELVGFQVSHGSHASYLRWLDLDASGALDDIAGFSVEKELNWRHGDEVTSVVPMLVTANFFDVTGMPVYLGRTFTAPEARAEDDPHVVVVTHSFWRAQSYTRHRARCSTASLRRSAYSRNCAAALRHLAQLVCAAHRTLAPELKSPDAAVVR
jgi:hypothetical protein